jgi:hydrogenase nickel incorporation protein HypA/HybF
MHCPQPIESLRYQYRDESMHEVGIISSAIETVIAQVHAHQAKRVLRIVLRIGVLAGVEVEALRFAFEVVARDTLVANAELQIDTVPARAYCATCAEEFEAGGHFIITCSRCGNLSGDLRQGRELELSRIEMD